MITTVDSANIHLFIDAVKKKRRKESRGKGIFFCLKVRTISVYSNSLPMHHITMLAITIPCGTLHP